MSEVGGLNLYSVLHLLCVSLHVVQFPTMSPHDKNCTHPAFRTLSTGYLYDHLSIAHVHPYNTYMNTTVIDVDHDNDTVLSILDHLLLCAICLHLFFFDILLLCIVTFVYNS